MEFGNGPGVEAGTVFGMMRGGGEGGGGSGGRGGHNFSHILSSLKRSNLSIGNRLRSIYSDSAFVLRVSAAYGDRPLVANERCGSWYIPPGNKSGSAYFKSTDGHHGQWSFSTRRLNLGLLEIVGREDGCVVVDSTRRGKRMPDALSKTVPMWCCVMNRVLFPDGFPPLSSSSSSCSLEEEKGDDDDDDDDDDEGGPFVLHTPPNAVSRSEHVQMEARIPSQVEALRSLNIDVEGMRARIRKPLRPVWVTRDSVLPDEDLSSLSPFFDDVEQEQGKRAEGGKEESRNEKQNKKQKMKVFNKFHPIICCTSSRRVVGEAEMGDDGGGGGAGYIQGAGDDTENWALGLTPPVFWGNADLLLGTPDHELPDLVRELVATAATAEEGKGLDGKDEEVGRELTPGLFVADRRSIGGEDGVDHSSNNEDDDDDGCYSCTIVFHPRVTDPDTWEEKEMTGAQQQQQESATKTQNYYKEDDDSYQQQCQRPRKGRRRREWHMDVGIGAQPKLAGRNLRTALPRICDYVERYLAVDGQQQESSSSNHNPDDDDSDDDDKKRKDEKGEEKERDTNSSAADTRKRRRRERRILIACDTGRDLSIGVALALLCRFPEKLPLLVVDSRQGDAVTVPPTPPLVISKSTIKQRLGRIMTAYPEANPSRATLQSVNSYLMG